MRVLILSPHTDDAELGCGGTIVRFLDCDHEIFWVVFSTAEESLPEGLPEDTLKKEYYNVIKDLSLEEKDCKVFDYNVRNLHQYRQEVLENLIEIRNQYAPDLVIGPSLNDFHQDHQVVAHEMVRAFKTTSSVLSYELPWNHAVFNMQCFVKLDPDHIKKKCLILKHYRSQFIQSKPYFSREFIYGLAKARGVQCNSEYAEAFEVVRWIH